MITDRQRFGSDDLLVQRIAAAARSGVHLVQIRERSLEGGAYMRLVQRSVEAARGHATRILVNDRVDVALAAGAHGVHLRADSLPAARIREAVPAGFVIGCSVHSPGDAVRAAATGGVDFLIFGTVFPSRSKPARPAAGAAALAAVVAATALPVLAVGGMTVETTPLAAATGAAGVAAIGLFADTPDECLPARLQEIALAFDQR